MLIRHRPLRCRVLETLEGHPVRLVAACERSPTIGGIPPPLHERRHHELLAVEYEVGMSDDNAAGHNARQTGRMAGDDLSFSIECPVCGLLALDAGDTVGVGLHLRNKSSR